MADRELEYYVELVTTVVRHCRVVASSEEEAVEKAKAGRAEIDEREENPQWRKTYAWPVDRSVYKILNA